MTIVYNDLFGFHKVYTTRMHHWQLFYTVAYLIHVYNQSHFKISTDEFESNKKLYTK